MASPQEKIWIEEYLQCWNATEAARRAGYRFPNKIGPAKKIKFADKIQERIDEVAMSADEVLVRLAQQARGDITDFVEIAADGSVTLNLEKAKAAGLTHLIRKLSHNAQGKVDLELYDAQKALQLLGKHHGLFKEKVEHSGEIDLALDDPRTELLSRIHRLAARASAASGDPGDDGG